MKALTIHRHGGPEVLHIDTSIEEPTAAPGEAVLDVRASALNHLELWIRNGRPGASLPMPHILGSDASGVVTEVGEGVHNVKPGDEAILDPGFATDPTSEYVRRGEKSTCPSFGIVGFMRPGTHAEKVAVPAANLRPKPAHLSFEQAAALSLAHLTAFRMLHTRAQVRPGETVLIHGIGGGVALAALQFAKLAGARAIVTSSRTDKLDRARDLGADHVIDYVHVEDVAQDVLDHTDGHGVDIAVDAVGAATWPINLQAVRKGGRIVHCGITTGKDAPANIQAIYWKQLTVMGSTMGSDEDYRLMVETVAATGLVPVIDSVHPLDKGIEALARMEAGDQFGKIVLATG